MTIDDKHFVTTYLQLISLDSPVTNDSWNTFQSYKNIESLGPSLPVIDTPLPIGHDDVDDHSEMVNITIKSIKPPKFSTEVKISNNETIYKVKTKLIDDLKLNIDAAAIKFLVKGKVIQDSTVVKDLDNLSFMCMVSNVKSDTNAKSEAKTSEQHVDDDMDIDSKPDTISEAAWLNILNILINDGKSKEMANEMVQKFKSSI